MADSKKEQFLRITVHMNGEAYTEDLSVQARMAPDIEGLNKDLCSNPARFAWWAMLEALAQDRVYRLEEKITRLDDQLMGGMPDGEKVTFAKAKIRQDPDRLKLCDELLDAKRDLALV